VLCSISCSKQLTLNAMQMPLPWGTLTKGKVLLLLLLHDLYSANFEDQVRGAGVVHRPTTIDAVKQQVTASMTEATERPLYLT